VAARNGIVTRVEHNVKLGFVELLKEVLKWIHS